MENKIKFNLLKIFLCLLVFLCFCFLLPMPLFVSKFSISIVAVVLNVISKFWIPFYLYARFMYHYISDE
jgi:hypothetical protein